MPLPAGPHLQLIQRACSTHTSGLVACRFVVSCTRIPEDWIASESDKNNKNIIIFYYPLNSARQTGPVCADEPTTMHMQTNKLDTSIEQALSPTELTAYFERTALQAVQQHIEELNGFVVVDGYLDAIPDATAQGWHFRVVLSDGNAANKATVLLDVPSAVLSRADARVGDRVRVRGLLITNVYRNALSRHAACVTSARLHKGRPDSSATRLATNAPAPF